MAVSKTVTEPTEGSAGTLTATASANSITVSNCRFLFAYIDDATNDGTFGRDSADQAPLPKQTWVEVWRRTDMGSEGTITMFFASTSGTPTLYFRAAQ